MKVSDFSALKEQILNEENNIITYFGSKLPLFNRSNIFFRDFQFILHSYLEMKGKKVSYAESEQLSSILLDRWNSVGAITMVSKNTWRVNTLVQPKIAAEPEAALA